MHVGHALFALACAAALPGADPAVQLTLRPQSIEIEQRLQFDAQGNRQHEQSGMSLQLNAFYLPVTANVVAYSNLRFSEIKTDAGETLSGEPTGTGVTRIDEQRRARRNGPAFSMYVRIDSPPKQPAKSLSVTGTIDLALADAVAKTAEIKPIKDFVGQRVQIEGVPGAEVTVIKRDDSSVELSFPREVDAQMAEVTFLDAAGAPCDTHGWGGNNTGAVVRRTWQVKVPGDGAIVLRFHQGLKSVTVPFTVADIPFPGAPEAAKPAAKVTAKDAPAVVPATTSDF
ncbi:MAG: hypothetical protein H0W72_09070 [Planctomycetes bacterium]|nr:hypothetical protein [Planctomycetota bacterium]